MVSEVLRLHPSPCCSCPLPFPTRFTRLPCCLVTCAASLPLFPMQACTPWACRTTATLHSWATQRCPSWSGQRWAGGRAGAGRGGTRRLSRRRTEARNAVPRAAPTQRGHLCSSACQPQSSSSTAGHIRRALAASPCVPALHAPELLAGAPPLLQLFLYPIGAAAVLVPLAVLAGLNPTKLALWYWFGYQ